MNKIVVTNGMRNALAEALTAFEMMRVDEPPVVRPDEWATEAEQNEWNEYVAETNAIIAELNKLEHLFELTPMKKMEF